MIDNTDTHQGHMAIESSDVKTNASKTDKPKMDEKFQLLPLSIYINDGQAPDPLGLDESYIRVDSIEGQESISQPFTLTVELRADDVLGRPAGAKVLDSQCIGQWACIRILQPINGAAIVDKNTKPPIFPNLSSSSLPYDHQGQRYFRGIITEISIAAPGCYTLTLSSPLALLNSRNRYHIYSHVNVGNLIIQLFEHEMLGLNFKVKVDLDTSKNETLSRCQDWLQAGESDFDFLKRILSKTSIYYYFVHQRQSLTLVFTDKAVMPKGAMAMASDVTYPLNLRYTYTSMEALAMQQNDLFCGLRYSVKMVPSYVHSLLTRTEAEWEGDTVATFESYSAANQKTRKLPNFTALAKNKEDEASTRGYQHHLYYDYGVSEDETKQQLTKICQQIQTGAGTLTGTVTSAFLSPGYTFTLQDYLVEGDEKYFASGGEGQGQVRTEFVGKTYVVTSVKHKMSSSTAYSGSVEATEVNPTAEECEQTLLSPFSMQNTQQGSVLAHVIEGERPDGWRFRNKNNFNSSKSDAGFDKGGQKESYHETGCKVRLATGQEHWVSLSRPSQTVPEVGAMVIIGRGSNASEEPEIQQILASHGSKCIQKPGRRNASWQANSNWGSNYSTSYGDSISIRFSNQSPTSAAGLKTISTMLFKAYDHDDISKSFNNNVANSLYGNSSYSRGSSWSMSLSDNKNEPDAGVLSASISQGSSFNESHAKVSYSVSDTGTSHNFSRTGKSVNRSITGEYHAGIDMKNPSFVDGHLPEKSIVKIADTLEKGDSYNENYTYGKSISLSGNGVKPLEKIAGYKLPRLPKLPKLPSILGGLKIPRIPTLPIPKGLSLLPTPPTGPYKLASQYSDSVTVGAVVNKSTTVGSTTSIDRFFGNKNTISVTIGLENKLDIFLGASITKDIRKGRTIDYTVHEEESETNVTKNLGFTENKKYLGVHIINETTVGDETREIINEGAVNITVSNKGVMTEEISNEGAVNTTVSNKAAVTEEISNEGAVNTTVSNKGVMTEEISNEGAVNTTVSNKGVVTEEISNEGAVNTTVSNKGVMTEEISNEGEVNKSVSNTGAVTTEIKNLGDVNETISSVGASTRSDTYLGIRTETDTCGAKTVNVTSTGPEIVSKEGSPCVTSDLRMQTTTVDMVTTTVVGTMVVL